MMIWLTKEAFGYAYEFVSVQVTAFLYATLIDDHPKFSQKTLVMSLERCIFAAGFHKSSSCRKDSLEDQKIA